MNRINTVNVTQHVFEEDVSYLNLYLLGNAVGAEQSHMTHAGAENHRNKVTSSPGIILKITRTTEGDFMFEKVKEYP